MTTTELPISGSRENLGRGHVLALPGVWAGSVLVFVAPLVSKGWSRVPVWTAALVAGVNTVMAFGWIFAILVCQQMWGQVPAIEKHPRVPGVVPVTEGWRPAGTAAKELVKFLSEGWKQSGPLDKSSMIVGTLGLIASAYLVPFFVLLPFGARPGSNKAGARHVARTVLLGSGLVHWWGIGYCVVVLAAGRLLHEIGDLEHWGLFWLLSAFCVLLLWHLMVLVYAVRREYRGEKAMPERHDPWCDDCGYNLIMATDAGRCPECGRAVTDSLGAHTRPETAWEQRPRFWNWRVIGAQVSALVRHPRKLFFSMPTLTGQRAAQKWLIDAMVIVGLVGAMIVPAIYQTGGFDWNWVAAPSAGAMGLVWAIFGMMMVGIETMGIATFSRLRRQPPGGVYLAAAAKVTCYASILMLVWVVLGGAQLVALVYYAQDEHRLDRVFHLGPRGAQMVVAGSFAIAHIGGLLWFELTVYRGVRAIQFANK